VKKNAINLPSSSIDRAKLVDAIHIDVQEQDLILKFADTLMAKAVVLLNPGGVRVGAPTGYGKSEMVKAITRKYPERDEGGQTIVPVVCFEVPEAPTVETIALRLLDQLKFPFASQQSPENQFKLLVEAFREAQVRLVIADEWNEVCKGHRQIASSRICEFVRKLYDATNVPWAFFGTHELEKSFLWYPPLASRCSATISCRDMPFGKAFIKLLDAFDELLPTEALSGLGQEALARQIHEATQGNFRALKTLLRNAVLMLPVDQGKSIEQKHLSAAFIQLAGDRANPFR
jgi:hypothetical protein